MENYILLAMGIFLGGAALLTAWCIRSRADKIRRNKSE